MGDSRSTSESHRRRVEAPAQLEERAQLVDAVKLVDTVKLEENVSLAPRTTLGVGGTARYLARACDRRGLDALRRFAGDAGLQIFVLGGGSNLLVADAGYDGLVVELADEEVTFEADGAEHELVRAGAAADWDGFVARCVARGLAGVECLSGIPGRVGAAPIQNIGAYGQEVAETVESVDVFDLADGSTRRIPAAECGFDYRWSRFKDSPGLVVTAVRFRLRRSAHGTARYPDLRRRLGLPPTVSEEASQTASQGASEGADKPSLDAVRQAVLDVRRTKSMVLDADDPNRRSAGSFFVNPVVDAETAQTVVAAAQQRVGREPAGWAVGSRVKLSAAWLIEAAGFEKGHEHGHAGISTKHSLALVNRGGATATEIVDLARTIRDGVREAFGVELRPEPTLLGFGEADPFLSQPHAPREDPKP